MNNFVPPLITIVIPHFNRTDLVAETLSSVCQQSYPNWELLVVDDGSTADSRNELARLCTQDPRIHLYDRNREPKGANACRNIGVEKARGDYLIFLDSDDLLAPFALEQRVRVALTFPSCDYLIFQSQLFCRHVGDAGTMWNSLTDADQMSRFLRCDSVWHTSGPLWRRDAVRALHGFDEHLACWQDLDFHIRALATNMTYRVFFDLPADCHIRRHDADSISQQPFRGRAKMSSLVTVFLTAVDLPACQATSHRRDGLAELAKKVAFLQLESRNLDLYAVVMDEVDRLNLFSRQLRRQMRLLSAFFRLGGYQIKGTHYLRRYFLRMLNLGQ